MKAAISNGAMTQNLSPLVAPCVTGNCTWPSTATLSVCGACTHNVSYQTVCDCEEVDYSVSCLPSCNYTMPSGSVATLASFIQGAEYIGGLALKLYSVRGPSITQAIQRDSTLRTSTFLEHLVHLQARNTLLSLGQMKARLPRNAHFGSASRR